MSKQEFLRKIMTRVKTQVSLERVQVQLLLSEFQEAFATHLSDIKVPSLSVPKFSINSISSDPAFVGPRYKKKFPEAERSAIEKTTKEWLENNIIEPCLHQNPVINNLLTVPKPDKSLRVCIDTSPVNRATPSDTTVTQANGRGWILKCLRPV